MAVTQADIDNLNAAIASGTRSVTLGGQTITYGTVEALIAARNDLQVQLNRSLSKSTGQRKRKVSYLYHAGRDFKTPGSIF